MKHIFDITPHKHSWSEQEQHEAEIKAIRNHVSHPEAHFASVQTKTMVNRVTHAKTSLQSDDWTLCLCCHLHLSSTVNQRSDHLFTYSTCRPKVYGCLLLDVSIFCHYSNSKVRISNFMMQYIPDCDSITLEDNLDAFFCFFYTFEDFLNFWRFFWYFGFRSESNTFPFLNTGYANKF